MDSGLSVLTNIVQTHPTLEVLDIEAVLHSHKKQLQLSPLVEAAGCKSQLKELRLPKHNYDRLPSHIREAHKQLLKLTDVTDFLTAETRHVAWQINAESTIAPFFLKN